MSAYGRPLPTSHRVPGYPYNVASLQSADTFHRACAWYRTVRTKSREFWIQIEKYVLYDYHVRDGVRSVAGVMKPVVLWKVYAAMPMRAWMGSEGGHDTPVAA